MRGAISPAGPYQECLSALGIDHGLQPDAGSNRIADDGRGQSLQTNYIRLGETAQARDRFSSRTSSSVIRIFVLDVTNKLLGTAVPTFEIFAC